MTIHIINGPNLNLIGIRQVEIYGAKSFDEFIPEIKTNYKDLSFQYFQSNHEGQLIDYIHQNGFLPSTAAIINPGAYSHTSIALMDAILSVNIPFVEVHLSDISTREKFRQHSYVTEACISSFMGKGFLSYVEAIEFLKASSFSK